MGFAAVLVSTVSSMAAGGGGLVLAPLALFLGFPPQVVLASAKAGGMGLNIGALSKFIRHREYIDWRWAGRLSVLALIASLLGMRLVFILSADTLRHAVAIIAIGLVPFLFFQRNVGLHSRHVSHRRKAFGVVAYFVIMAAQAGLGSGVGVLLMFVLMSQMGLDALHVNATKRVAGLTLVTISFLVFAFSGYINWVLAACLFGGTLIGDYVGAHIAVKHGNKLVKSSLLVVSVVMGIAILVH